MKKLNIGCGADYRDGYINLDFDDKDSSGNKIKVDIVHDFLKKELPFDESSIDEVIFHECLEHVNRYNGLKILKDIFRILKPGGLLDLTVPPAAEQLRLLMLSMSSSKNLDMSDFFDAHKKWSVWKRHDDLMGGCEKETDGTDGHSHKTLYTKEMLKPILEYVGFKIISIDNKIFVKAIK